MPLPLDPPALADQLFDRLPNVRILVELVRHLPPRAVAKLRWPRSCAHFPRREEPMRSPRQFDQASGVKSARLARSKDSGSTAVLSQRSPLAVSRLSH